MYEQVMERINKLFQNLHLYLDHKMFKSNNNNPKKRNIMIHNHQTNKLMNNKRLNQKNKHHPYNIQKMKMWIMNLKNWLNNMKIIFIEVKVILHKLQKVLEFQLMVKVMKTMLDIGKIIFMRAMENYIICKWKYQKELMITLI